MGRDDAASAATSVWTALSTDDQLTLARLREVVRLAPIGVGIVDRRGRAVLTNDALSAMLGYSPEEFADLPFEVFTHPDDIAPNLELFGELMSGQRERFEMDKRFIHRDGHIVWGRLLVSLLREEAADGGERFAIGLLQDITEEKRLRDELERLAFHDPLTDLANRRLLVERISDHLERGHRTGRFGAVLFADLAHADVVRERLHELISAPVDVVGHHVIPKMTTGVVMLSAAYDADGALREADLAMYAAKPSGPPIRSAERTAS